MPVDQMLRSMTALEVAEYMALERIDGPIGELRADLRAGIVASAVANHGMSPPKTPTRPLDFMPYYRRPAATIKLTSMVEHGKLLARTLFGGLLGPKKGPQ